MATVTFVGTGEACDPDLPNTSLLYRGSRVVLLDCGYSVPAALWRITRDPGLIDAVFLSHAHADHIFGLPGLLLWMRDAGRTDRLRVLAGASTCELVRDMVELAYPGLLDSESIYPVEMVPIAPAVGYSLGSLMLKSAPSEHAADNLAVRIEEEGRAVCFSGDGGPTDATRELYEGADLLVHECYHAVPHGRGHASLTELLDLEVERLALVHLGVASKEQVRLAAGGAIIPAPGDIFSLPR